MLALYGKLARRKSWPEGQKGFAAERPEARPSHVGRLGFANLPGEGRWAVREGFPEATVIPIVRTVSRAKVTLMPCLD